jgi:hypothetical protein
MWWWGGVFSSDWSLYLGSLGTVGVPKAPGALKCPVMPMSGCCSRIYSIKGLGVFVRNVLTVWDQEHLPLGFQSL